jgi:hypothetical protein
MASANFERDLNKLYPVAMIGFIEKTYPSVKEALEDSFIKQKMLNAFTDYAQLAEQGKCYSTHSDMGKDIIDCIVEYPKVIIEDHFSKDYNHMCSELESIGELRLPFPKITLIAGEITNQEPNQFNSTLKTLDAPKQDGSVNLIYSCFLLQEQNGISVNTIFCKPNRVGKEYYVGTLFLTIKDGKLLMATVDNYNNAVVAETDTLTSLAYLAIIATHMLTLSGGNMYISTPTPDEVKINRKRLSKGKKPLVEFRLITIDTEKKDTEITTSQGTHASPRQHWRRGHYRTTPKGKKVWIDPMLVGDEKNGKIIKDYAVGKYEREMNDRPR